jgi:uncharacterized membrane protein
MALLVVGLVLFLGAHSIRVFADDWRTATIARIGELKWKRYFSLASLAGFVLIIVGYGMARSASSPDLYTPPTWARHLAIVLVAIAFVLLAAGGKGPPNRIRAAVGHPQILGVKVWAFAHLLANGRVVDVLLFGAFLAWAIADYTTSRRRDRVLGVKRDPGTMAVTVVTMAVGLVGFMVFAVWLHPWLIGVPVLY